MAKYLDNTGLAHFWEKIKSYFMPKHYGTCTTAAATAAKEATVGGTFTLETGAFVYVKMSNANSVANPTLDVNDTGAHKIMRYGTTAASTNANTSWYAGTVVGFVYDGTNWLMLDFAHRGNDNTVPSAYCTTAAGTAAKAATFTNYNLLAKSYFMLVISTTNSVEGAITLNVNGKGAKPIYINGAASSASNHTMPAGTYLVYYDGSKYYVRTDGKITGSITGDAATVNGKTVAVSVPSGAKFTDTTYSVATADTDGLMSADDKSRLSALTGFAADCQTAAGTAAKVAMHVSGSVRDIHIGEIVAVRFVDTNTAAVADLTLKVDNSEAYPIKYRGGNLPFAGALASNRWYFFALYLNQWNLIGDLNGISDVQQSTVTMGTNAASVGAAPCRHNGAVCTVTIVDVALKAALNSGSNVVIGTVPEGYRPLGNVYGQCIMSVAGYGNVWCRILTNGELRISNFSGKQITTSQTITLTLTYVI